MVRLSSLQLSSNQSTTTTGDGPTGALPAQPRPSSERTACCSSSQTLHLQTCKIHMQTETAFTSSFGCRSIPDVMRLPVVLATTSLNGATSKIWMYVGILFLAILWAEIVLRPVWAGVISIFGITRLPVTSSTTPLNSSTLKTSI